MLLRRPHRFNHPGVCVYVCVCECVCVCVSKPANQVSRAAVEGTGTISTTQVCVCVCVRQPGEAAQPALLRSAGVTQVSDSETRRHGLRAPRLC